mmetsp:Transcript_1556/g.1871  ORF Transcript_1556/g.1871 Transcript_1556/m.1871 type:complete len:138 (+) Transcript_1556:132-545(+)
MTHEAMVGKENVLLNNAASDHEVIPFASIRDRITACVNKAIDSETASLEKSAYNSRKMKELTSKISHKCVQSAQDISNDFKFVAQCVGALKSDGMNLLSNSSCVWDANVDGNCMVRWENKSAIFVVYIWGLQLYSSA